MDWRLVADRHTNSHLPQTFYTSKEEVDARREELRFGLRMSTGLYPWPEKTPLNVRREVVGVYEGYSVEKIMFETVPGFWSTGNLYLPHPLPEKSPAIAYFMGHFDPQRLTREDRIDVPQQLANFARMGFICLVTDMIGKIDSMQISHEYGRDEKELWLSNGLGVQLWNNIRAVDVLCAMPEVDAERIGATGCSGGGTQTLTLCVVDERIKAAAPINMISLEMQGGCQCENAPGLRIHTDNCELCAMLAPMPLFLAGSTGDWTRNQETVEYPMLRATYALYGAEENVEHFYQVAGHQYNAKTRHRVYSFFARKLLGKDPGWVEQPIETQDLQALTWFAGKGHAPGLEGDEAFFEAHKQDVTKRVAALGRDEKKKMLAWVTGIRDFELFTAEGSFFERNGMKLEHNVAVTHAGVQLPFIRITPANWDNKRVCLAIGGNGKDCVDHEAVQKMLADGVAVISGDLFMLGEFTGRERKIMGGLQGERYYTTFHYTEDAYRMQDIALLWKEVCRTGTECTLWADGKAARAAACALPQLADVKHAWLEKAALELEGDAAYHEQFRVPGVLVLGGMEGCLQLADCPVEKF